VTIVERDKHLPVVYMVRNKDGLWFRRKGYGGYGESWTNDQTLARLYGRVAGARTVVGWFAKAHPEFGVPEIVCAIIGGWDVIDETKRVAAVLATAERRAKTKHVHSLRCGFDRNGSHNAGHYVCLCGFEDRATEVSKRRGTLPSIETK
jgi:hypothetical protein